MHRVSEAVVANKTGPGSVPDLTGREDAYAPVVRPADNGDARCVQRAVWIDVVGQDFNNDILTNLHRGGVVARDRRLTGNAGNVHDGDVRKRALVVPDGIGKAVRALKPSVWCVCDLTRRRIDNHAPVVWRRVNGDACRIERSVRIGVVGQDVQRDRLTRGHRGIIVIGDWRLIHDQSYGGDARDRTRTMSSGVTEVIGLRKNQRPAYK